MLKLINIPNIVYDWLTNGFPNEDDVEHILEILRGGITIPDNATNGDVIDAMFKDDDRFYLNTDKNGFIHFRGVKKDWLDEPYQKGGKK